MIQDSQMNKVFLSDLLPTKAPRTYRNLMSVLNEWDVETSLIYETKDIWCRDFMPIQVGAGRFQSYRYAPDYLVDNKEYGLMTDGAPLLRDMGMPADDTLRNVILDGGNVVRCGSKVVMTAKVLEENPGFRPFALLELLEAAFDADVILVPWDTNEEFGHADGISRYVGDDTVLMNNYRQFDSDMADRFRKALDCHFNVSELNIDVPSLNRNSWAYINWLQTDKVIVVPSIDSASDQMAVEQIEAVLPSYKGRVVLCPCQDLIPEGGGLNCCTWTVRE